MKPDQKVIVIFFLSSILIGIAAAYLLPRFIYKPSPLLNQAGIVRYVSAQSELTEEYHLWLRLEMSIDTFDAIFSGNNVNAPKDAPAVKKDELRSERLVTGNVIPETLAIRGYGADGPVTNTGLLLRIDKTVILSKENIRPLESESPLADPQTVPRQRFQPQTDIYQTVEAGKALLYIHLESGIKPRNAPRALSLTAVYMKDNAAALSKTLPLFQY